MWRRQLTLALVGQQHVTSRAKGEDEHERPDLERAAAALGRGVLSLRAAGAVRALREGLLAEERGRRLCHGAAGRGLCRRRGLSAEGRSEVLLLLAQQVGGGHPGAVAHQLPGLAGGCGSHCSGCVPRRSKAGRSTFDLHNDDDDDGSGWLGGSIGFFPRLITQKLSSVFQCMSNFIFIVSAGADGEKWSWKFQELLVSHHVIPSWLRPGSRPLPVGGTRQGLVENWKFSLFVVSLSPQQTTLGCHSAMPHNLIYSRIIHLHLYCSRKQNSLVGRPPYFSNSKPGPGVDFSI